MAAELLIFLKKIIPYLFNDNTYVCIIIYNVNGLAFKGTVFDFKTGKQMDKFSSLFRCSFVMRILPLNLDIQHLC